MNSHGKWCFVRRGRTAYLFNQFDLPQPTTYTANSSNKISLTVMHQMWITCTVSRLVWSLFGGVSKEEPVSSFENQTFSFPFSSS